MWIGYRQELEDFDTAYLHVGKVAMERSRFPLHIDSYQSTLLSRSWASVPMAMTRMMAHLFREFPTSARRDLKCSDLPGSINMIQMT